MTDPTPQVGDVIFGIDDMLWVIEPNRRLPPGHVSVRDSSNDVRVLRPSQYSRLPFVRKGQEGVYA